MVAKSFRAWGSDGFLKGLLRYVHACKSLRQLAPLLVILCLSPAAIGQSRSGQNATNVHIPDDGGWVASTITITGAPAGSVVTRIDAYFRCVHTYSADLVVDLNADAEGEEGNIHLWNREGGSADNPSRTVSDIHTYDGLSVNRTWYLYARDYETQDIGYIDEWSLVVHYSVPLQPPTLVDPGYTSAPGEPVNTLTPTMSWQASSGATGYGLYISRNDAGAWTLIYDNDSVPNQTSLILPSGYLQAGQEYRWNMRARNASGWSTFSTRLYFQTSAPCVYSLSPTDATVAANAGAYSFGVVVGPGCEWSASDNRSWINTTSSGSGTGTVNYTVDQNSNTNSRTGSIAVQGQVFTVTQGGAPPVSGACCIGGDTCVTGITQSACTSQGGIWQGPDSTSCSSCSAPTGACCIGGTTCATGMTQDACADQGGTWQGADSISCIDCSDQCPPHAAQCAVDAYGQVNGLALRLPWRTDEQPSDGYQVSQGYCPIPPGEHRGFEVDFEMPTGTRIVALAPGWVVHTGDDVNAPNGKFVRIQHDPVDGVYYTSWYLHLSERHFKNGQCGARVLAGETIGLSGNTGDSTGPHLHLQVESVDGVATPPDCGNAGYPTGRIRVRPVPMFGRDVAAQTNTICDFVPDHWYRAMAVGGDGEPCPADFNGDDIVNSPDFFDFLAAFFSGSPSADFNRDGATNSLDFFDFLTAFFTGC